MKYHDHYYQELFLAWAIRAVLAASIVAVMVSLGACTHDLDLSSKGSLHKDNPPSSTTVAN